MTLKVFISYAKEDKDFALDYFDRLTTEGTSPWLDEKKILPGQHWEYEIDRALKEANVVVILLSPRSVNKRGFVQREAQEAIEQLRYKKENDIYILPLVLEHCEVPSFISNKLQYIDMLSTGAWEKVQNSLALAAEQQQIDLQRGTLAGPFHIFTEKIADARPGNPGYEINIEYPKFVSMQYPGAAQELSMFFAGRAAQSLVQFRGKPWEQDKEDFPDNDEFPPENTLFENFGIAYASEKFLSITYNSGHYYAGAAHGNSSFDTFNFSIENGVQKIELVDFFRDIKGALNVISNVCIEKLSQAYWELFEEKPDTDQIDWFKNGAGPKLENFLSYNLNSDGFTFLFPPYQVSAYALGSWSAEVSFYNLIDYLVPNGPHTLVKSRKNN